MNCDSCQQLLSDFLDESLDREHRMQVVSHLAGCSDCTAVQDELLSILHCGVEYRDHLVETPPNPQALWLRISNIIESEMPAPELASARQASTRTGWLNRSWRFTLPQMAVGVAALVITVSVLTTLGIRNFAPNRGATASLETVPRAGKNSDQLLEQQIAYWDQRVQQRKAQWNQQTRDAFDRNVQILDQAVADYRRELQSNPNDEVSAEMLHSALNEKMTLLQDFAE
jgi:anti-sigma factor RsiW